MKMARKSKTMEGAVVLISNMKRWTWELDASEAKLDVAAEP